MALDVTSNFAKTTIDPIASGATSVVLANATNFPDPSGGEYNCVIWEISSYGNPADDANVEIVRMTAKSGSTYTITRAQESTSDSNHNTGGATYAIAIALTSKMITDIENSLDGKTIAPATNTADYIPQWDGANSKTLKDGLAVPAGGLAGLTALGGKEDASNKATTFGTINDTLYPTVKAVKDYADGLVVGLLDYRGAYDASGNAYPTTGGSGTAGAVLKGDMWIISVAGTLGGEAVQVGDSIIANIDTPAQTASNWNHLNGNISYVPENVSNKVTSISGASTDTQYPSAKLTYDQLVLKAPLTAPTFATSITGSYLTASEMLITDADKKIVSAPVATYPSLTELSYVKGVTSAIQTQLGAKASITGVETLTNKRITKRVASTTDDATAVIDSDSYDEYYLTAIANPTEISITGTPTTGQTIFIGLKDAGGAKGLTWTGITALGCTLPTTTVAGKQHIIGVKYIGGAWKGIAVSVES